MSKFFQTLTQPMQAVEGDYWVDKQGNVAVLMAGTWVKISTAHRESELEEDIIPQPEDTFPVSFEIDKKAVERKLEAFQEVLNHPEPPQRLGFEKDLQFVNDSELDGSGIQYLSTVGIALINRSKTP